MWILWLCFTIFNNCMDIPKTDWVRYLYLGVAAVIFSGMQVIHSLLGVEVFICPGGA